MCFGRNGIEVTNFGTRGGCMVVLMASLHWSLECHLFLDTQPHFWKDPSDTGHVDGGSSGNRSISRSLMFILGSELTNIHTHKTTLLSIPAV
jgi:hypothetical protein